MESQPTKRWVPGRYGLANAETDGPVVFPFEPRGVAHAAYTPLGSARESRRGRQPPKLPTWPRDRFFHVTDKAKKSGAAVGLKKSA